MEEDESINEQSADEDESTADTHLNAGENDVLMAKAVGEFKKIHGVGDAVARKLWDGGYYTLTDIAATSVGNLVDKATISKAMAEKIIAEAKGLANIGQFSTADSILSEEDPLRLSTGSSAVDELIGGGYVPKLLTEIHAQNGVGKTQMCITASVIATLPKDQGGLDADVVYVDTEGTFKAHRAAEIAKSRGLDVKACLSRIHVVLAHNTSEQIVLIDEIKKIVAEKHVGLIVIDSVIGHFRAEYISRSCLAERQQLLNHYLSDLHHIAETYNLCVLLTNQMAANPNAFMNMNPQQAVGGNILGHACAYRILIRKGAAGKRVAKLVKSPDLPEGESIFKITSKGATDN